MIRYYLQYIFFPGVIFHEFGHFLFCILTGVRVRKVCFFRFGNPAGYVEHDQTHNFLQAFFISFGPFIAGTILSILCFMIAKYPKMFYVPLAYWWALFIWLGVSIGFHSFPSKGDAKVLWHETNRHIRRNPLAIIIYPFVLLIYVANLLRFLWIDLVYPLFLFVIVWYGDIILELWQMFALLL